MRLINVRSLEMKEFYGSRIPPYIILSHRWQDDEISYQDFEVDKGQQKTSYHKIEHLCQIARDKCIDWVWSDTCCIDKRNSTELSEAINSMYKWYQQSQLCIAYLYDIDNNFDALGSSTWFTRCWTLQELIAPIELEFYGRTWNYIGRKSDMCEQLSAITKIDRFTLAGADPRRCSVAQRMSWASSRQATRIEDEAYSLLGLFNVSMPMLYGDGEQAFMSLQERIAEKSDDQSILAWDIKLDRSYANSPAKTGEKLYGLLATSPSAFASCGEIVSIPKTVETKDHIFTSTFVGIQLTLPIRPNGLCSYSVALDCTNGSDSGLSRQTILLRKLEEPGEFARIDGDRSSVVSQNKEVFEILLRHEASGGRRFVPSIKKMHVRQHIRSQPANVFNGIEIHSCDYGGLPLFQSHKTLVYSRDGQVTRYTGEKVVTSLPDGKFGISAIIVPPASAFHRCLRPIQYIQIGFDTDFHPFCIVGRRKVFTNISNLARDIKALYSQAESSSNSEKQKSQALLETIEGDIQKSAGTAINPGRVRANWSLFWPQSSLPLKSEAIRSSFGDFEIAAKAPQIGNPSIHLPKQGLTLEYDLMPPSTDQPSIWTVKVRTVESKLSLLMLLMAPLYLPVLAIGSFLGFLPFRHTQVVGQTLVEIVEISWWSLGYIDQYVSFFPLRTLRSSLGLATFVLAGIIFVMLAIIVMDAFLNAPLLTPEIVRALLNGTNTVWSPTSGAFTV